jgi:hypothetical protein
VPIAHAALPRRALGTVPPFIGMVLGLWEFRLVLAALANHVEIVVG